MRPATISTRWSRLIRSKWARNKRIFHRAEDAFPVVGCRLTEQAQAGIPGTVAAAHEPAPVRHMLERNPGGHAERAGQMRRRGVRADHQIAILHDSGRVEKGIRAL